MTLLSVNIDHIASIRQARQTTEPDPVEAAVICELAGAFGITIHLRGDRRHIQDRDLRLLRQTVKTKLNVEMATTSEMLEIACEVLPDQVTLVPELPGEVTTTGGLDCTKNLQAIAQAIERLKSAGMAVSLLIRSRGGSDSSGRRSRSSGNRAQYISILGRNPDEPPAVCGSRRTACRPASRGICGFP